jgi:hypothetical protein
MADVSNGESTAIGVTPPRTAKRKKEDLLPSSTVLSSSPPDSQSTAHASSSTSTSSPARKTKVKREKSGSKQKDSKASSSVVAPELPAPSASPSNSGPLSTVSQSFPQVLATSVFENDKTPEGLSKVKRMKLINEFMTSELQHVEALKTLVVEYVQPLRTLLPKETVKKLFGNIEVIMGWNMQFYGRLRARYEESEDFSMDSNVDDHEFLFGDIMVEMLVILRQIYSQYNENYEEAQLTYRELMKSKEFETHIRMTSNGNSKTHLLTLLYLPVGRMIVYDSLLKEIIQLTPPGHPDRDDLANAQKMIGAATRQANRVVEMRKNLHNVLRIQSLLQNAADIAEPHRRYVYEGTVVFEAGPKTFKERELFLFNDLVILAKPKRKKFEVEWSAKLTEVQVVDTDEDDRTRFKLKDAANTEILLASEEKPTWMYHFRAAIKNLGATPQELNALRIEEDHPGAYLDGSHTTNPERFLDARHLADLILRWSELKPDIAMNEIRTTAQQLKQIQSIEKM